MKKDNTTKQLFLGFILALAVLTFIIIGFYLYQVYFNKDLIKIKTISVENEVADAEEPSNETNEPTEERIPPEIVLYYGLDLSNPDLEISIPFTDENKQKYEITYYNYENGEYLGETNGELEETYEGVSHVANTKKFAISEKYDAVPRKFQTIETIPEKLKTQLEDYNNKVEVQAIDLDGDNSLEYIVACSSYSGNKASSAEYKNYSEISVYDDNFNKISTLVKSTNQFWEHNNRVTEEFFCDIDDVEYIDLDNDGLMEISVDLNVYEGTGVEIYKYKNGEITGNTDYSVSSLP